MRVVFHFDGSEALKARLAPLGVELCPESDAQAFERALPEMEVLWHVLKPVTAAVIARAPRLKLIQKIGSGVNTIDIEAARSRGIAVCNLPGVNSRAVAEMTLLLMLACLRRLPQLDAMAREPAGWKAAWALQESFGELGGKRVGLLGYGAVAKLLHPMLAALGAEVAYWSRSQRNTDFDELVSTADVLSLHLPLTQETRGMVDVRRMKRGAILINTARAGLVNPEELRDALLSGRLRAAGLDVFAVEPPVNDPLLALENVVRTPHLAWLTRETLERSIAAAWANVERLATFLPLAHRVA